MRRLLATLLSAALVSPSAAQVKTAVPVIEVAPVGVSGAAAAGASLAKPTLSPTLTAPSLTAPTLTLPSPASGRGIQTAPVQVLAQPAAPSAINAAKAEAPKDGAKAVVPDVGPAVQVAAQSTPADLERVAKDAARTEPAPVAKAVAQTQGRLGKLQPPAGTPERLADVDVIPTPGKTYYPSPADWRDEVVYSLMLDRFNRSKDGKPVGDPKSGVSRHGGDIKGVTEKLDYLKGLGVTAIIMSPVTMGIPEAYHGYAPTHLLAVDPHVGTMDDYKTMVAEAHKRGIRVILDLVLNHVGPVFEYAEGSKWRGMDGPAKEIGEWTNELLPRDMANPEHFTRRGVIDNWNDHDQSQFGDFPPNYRHWATEKREVQDDLIKVSQWWLKETDVDGVRLDAIRHMAPSFVARFGPEIKRYAASLGKKDFIVVGENSTGVDGEVLGDLSRGVDSGYNYPEYRRQSFALHGKAPTRQLEDSFRAAADALGGALGRIVRFIDNHDTYRFLRQGEPEGLLKAAFAFLLFSTGIPLVYYGAEQAFRQVQGRLTPEGGDAPADPQNREDMFADGEFKSEWSRGDKFDAASPAYKLLQKLAETRKDLAPLRRGAQYVRWSDPWGAGIYAFSRIHEGQEVVVVLNTAGEAREAEMFVDGGLTPAGTALADALDGAYGVETHAGAEGGSKVTVRVPAHGARVLVRKAK
ncbi:hypothetical protein EPO15_07015 [bacterium]|nr:MAG: hypothetical protein EPO15_07015 [bacterium]